MNRQSTSTRADSPTISNELFRSLFEQTRNFEVILTKDGCLVEANRQSLITFGFSRSDVIGQLFWKCPWWNSSRDSVDAVRNGCLQASNGKLFVAELLSHSVDGAQHSLNLTIAPVISTDGEVTFLHATGFFATNHHLPKGELSAAEDQTRFLNELAEATKPLIDPNSILRLCAQFLAEHIGADRCAYAEVEDESVFVITGDYATSHVPSIVGNWPIALFGKECTRMMLTDQPFIVYDVDSDLRIGPEDLPAYRATTIQAVICVPLHKGNKLTAAMAVHQATPRHWKPEEVQLVTTVVARCWETLERARAAMAEKRLQTEASAERARLQDVFHSAPSFMAVLHGPDHVFERVNESFSKLTGGRDLIGKTVSEAFPELSGREFFELLDRVYQTGEPYVTSNAHVSLHNPDSPETPTERDLEFVYQPMRDASGNITDILVQGIDLTERNRAQRELNHVMAESDKLRRLYETALSNTPDLVYIFDLDQRFTYANEALLHMYGKPWHEVVGRSLLELGYEPWHATMHGNEIEQVRASKHPIRGEVPFTGVQGRRIYDYIFAPVLGADGEVEAVAGTTRDVTERKAMEQALRDSDKKKDEFLAMLAHELRNPLAPIRSGLDLLRVSGTDTEVLDVMQRQVEHLVRLVDDLLDVSRIMRGKVELRMENIELSGMVKRAIETIKPMIESLHQTLTFTMPNQPIWLSADPIRLTQVLGNLLHNASKYTDAGGKLAIEITAEAQSVAIKITDNGIGISTEILPQIFDLFTQDQRNIDRSQGGLGIGLTVVKNLVEMHRGTIEAYSQGPGQGSEFTMRLPTIPAPAEPTPPLPEVPSIPPLNILVVDDNRSAIYMLTKLLSKLGPHHIFTAHDGLAALEVVENQPLDLVLLDIGLPNIDGFEVARRIRRMSERDHLRVVALTGYGTEEDRRKSSEAGFDEHLVKPPSVQILKKVLASIVPAS